MAQKPEFRDELDFRDLLRKPEKLFGYGYLYVLVAVVGLGLVYLGNLTEIGKNATLPLIPKDSSAFVADIALQRPVVLPPVSVSVAAVPSDSQVARGRDLYRANCASCHGDNGQGDGPAGIVLTPKPRNFHVTEGWTNGPKISQIYLTLQEGIVRNGMASYGYLPPADRFALIHYVRTFMTAPPADDPAALMQLEATYKLSTGMMIPGQIPVRRASEILISEDRELARRREALSSVVQTDESAGAKVLRQVTVDVSRLLTVLIAPQPVGRSLSEFKRTLSVDPAALGLKPAVARLDEAQWSALYSYVSALRFAGVGEGSP